MNKKLTALLFLFAITTGCDGIDITIDKARYCDLEHSEDFPTTEQDAQFDTDIPTGCPVSIPYVGYPIGFVANGWFPQGGSHPVNGVTYIFEHTDAFRYWRGNGAFATWQSLSGYWKLHVTGDYDAGLAGFNPYGVARADYLRSYLHRTGDANHIWAELVAYYGNGPRAAVYGPLEVIGWEGFTLNADLLDPNFVPPVTYTWKKNGNDMGVSTDHFYYPGSAPDSNDDFEVTVTDYYGDTAIAVQHVRTKNCVTPGCDDQ